MSSLSPSSSPSSAPTHAAPTLNASNVDVSPERGFFKSLWTKVVDVYTSTFKADERLDRLQNMPAHQQEIANAIRDWRSYSGNLDPSIQAHVKTISDVIGNIVENSGKTFSTAMDKLNEAYKEITGYTAAELTPTHRRELSMNQRVKLVEVYNKMKTELSSGKTPYNETAQVVNEVSAAVTDLLDLDTKQREELRANDTPRAEAIQAIAPALDQKLEQLHSQGRTKAFDDLANSEGVKTSSLDQIKEAIAAAKVSLEGIGSFLKDVVNRASETAEHFKKNEAVRNDTFSGIAQGDTTKKLAYVSDTTLKALKDWFDAKSTEAEAAIKERFAKAETQEDIAKWSDEAIQFGVTSERYRKTLNSVGASLAPFTPLIDNKDAPKIFKSTVSKVSTMFQATAVDFVKNLPHEEAIEKLTKLQALSTQVAERAKVDMASGGALTPDEKTLLLADVKIALETLKKGATKSWTH